MTVEEFRDRLRQIIDTNIEEMRTLSAAMLQDIEILAREADASGVDPQIGGIIIDAEVARLKRALP